MNDGYLLFAEGPNGSDARHCSIKRPILSPPPTRLLQTCTTFIAQFPYRNKAGIASSRCKCANLPAEIAIFAPESGFLPISRHIRAISHGPACFCRARNQQD
ncbi:hypothetical protein CSC3H3_13490 [Thalassospira marina]|uniref:Uncharacterized protein n=1 Tax=Thalassospira marina TaxID=2048283 RepID=A0ABN5FGE3_9PROT|nr:hypothetical protein CSC3H3_13490 [Thalassospira marina]